MRTRTTPRTGQVRRRQKDLNELVRARVEMLVQSLTNNNHPKLWELESPDGDSFREEMQEELESTWREESRNGFD